MSGQSLLPCPFCGHGDMLDRVESYGWSGVIHCDNCDATGPYPSGDRATSWNERHQTPKP